MIGIVCAFFHTEGKGFYSKRPQSVAAKERACCWFFNGDGSDNPQELFQVEKFR